VVAITFRAVGCALWGAVQGAARPRPAGVSIVLLIALFAVTLAAGAPARAAEDEPGHLKIAAGYKGDIFADRKSGGWFAFEYRPGPSLELWHVRPSFGVGGTTDASLYGWTALNVDIFFGRRVVLTPSTGVGLYKNGDGENLGNVVEFRNGVDLAWRFDDRSRLGVGLHYLSNYGIGDRDPGLGVVTLFYAHPLESILPD
jgi:hypothetical protein